MSDDVVAAALDQQILRDTPTIQVSLRRARRELLIAEPEARS